jgi:hypothetical protein
LSDSGTTAKALRWNQVTAPAGAPCIVRVDCNSSPVRTRWPSRQVSSAGDLAPAVRARAVILVRTGACAC